MKLLNLILGALLSLALIYVGNMIIKALPIYVIPTGGIFLLVVGIFSGLFIWSKYLEHTRKLGNDKKPPEPLPAMPSKTRLTFQILIRYLGKPLIFIKLIFSLLSKPFYWRSIGLKLLFLVIILFTFRIGVSYFLDSKWENPRRYSQVVPLHNLWGFQKDELKVSWQHFGNIKSQNDEPKTYLLSTGYGDSVISMSNFKRRYFALEPEILPRNNLTMLLKPKDPGKNLRDSFEKFALDLTKKQKISSHRPLTVYPIQIIGKTRGSELQFKRYFNFRARSLGEIILYYLFFLSFVIFAFYVINGPAIIKTLQVDTRISSLLNYIRRRLLRLLDNAMHLREPAPRLVHSIEITLRAVIEIHKCSGRDDQPHLADKLNTAATSVVTRLKTTDRLTHEVVQVIKGEINLIFDIVNEIHFRRVLVLVTKAEFEIFIYAVMNAGQNAERCQEIELEPTIEKQQATLEERCEQLNKKRRRLREAHETKVKIETQRILDNLIGQLSFLPLIIGDFTDPRKSLNKQVRQPGRPSIKNLTGGFKGGEIEFDIPEPVILSAQWKDDDVELNSTQSSLMEAAIPAEGIQKEKIDIDYSVFMETLKLKLNNIPQQLKPGTIRLRPKDENQIKELYDPLTVEAMIQKGLAGIAEE